MLKVIGSTYGSAVYSNMSWEYYVQHLCPYIYIYIKCVNGINNAVPSKTVVFSLLTMNKTRTGIWSNKKTKSQCESPVCVLVAPHGEYKWLIKQLRSKIWYHISQRS